MLIFKLVHFPRITVSPWTTLQHSAECFKNSYFKLFFFNLEKASMFDE